MSANGGTVVPYNSQNKITVSSSGIKNLFSKDSLFVGNIETKSGIKVDGSILGDVTIKAEGSAWLVVDKSGKIEGAVDATTVIVAGRIIGVIRAKFIVLMTSAIIDGDIFYETIRISEGAQINGQMHRGSVGNVLPPINQ